MSEFEDSTTVLTGSPNNRLTLDQFKVEAAKLWRNSATVFYVENLPTQEKLVSYKASLQVTRGGVPVEITINNDARAIMVVLPIRTGSPEEPLTLNELVAEIRYMRLGDRYSFYVVNAEAQFLSDLYRRLIPIMMEKACNIRYFPKVPIKVIIVELTRYLNNERIRP